MKKVLVIATTVLCLTAAAALAQMGGGRMDSPRSDRMMDERMMNEDMMRDMSGMMSQMNEMTQKVSGAMERRDRMDYTRRMDMSSIIGEMSQIMKEMSEQMAQRRMDPSRIKYIRERMNRLGEMMRHL